MAAKDNKSEDTVPDVPGIQLSRLDAVNAEKNYRSGVDISLFELADRFEQDGYDWRHALKECGYSDDEITEQVDSII